MTLAADAVPAAVPVRPAATIMLLEDRPDLHVLLLRRRVGSAFVGGMSVFPGGGVDLADAQPEVEACCAGLDDRIASRRLGVPRGGLAYWVAAVRETFEEAGVLLAVDAASGRHLDLSSPAVAQRFAKLRAEVDAGRARLADAVRLEGLRLSVDVIHYAARWITPEGPPRRYDTRFFVAALPTGQIAVHDDREAVDSEWRRPADALACFARGELAMLPPTVGMLRILAGFSHAADAVAAAAAQEDGPDRAARLIGEEGSWRVVLPGDADYETAPAQDLRAWVRLCPPGGAAALLPARGA